MKAVVLLVAVLLLGGLLALGIFFLRRQTLVEFPDAGPSPVDETEPSTASRVAASLKPKPAAEPATSQAADLARLAALHDSGALTDAEFTRAKDLALS